VRQGGTPRRPGIARLLGRALRISFATRAAYRGDFLVSLLVTVLLEAIAPLVTVLAYRAGARFPGWTMHEALLVQGTFLLARGIAYPCFFGMVWTVFEQVREGTFELTLLKPRSPLLVTLAQSVDVQGVGQLLGGSVLFAWAAAQLPRPGPAAILLFLGLLVLAVAVLMAIALFLAGSLFVWVGNGRVLEVSEAVMLFAQYPGSIYGRGFRVLVSTAVPVAMIAFLPAQALLARAEPLTAVAAACSLAFLGTALLFWRSMVSRYAGGGG
jgi:ABC-2 type transport system permease protein